MKENLTLVNHVEKVGSSVVNLKFECSFVMCDMRQTITIKLISQDSCGIRNMSFDTLSLLTMVRQLDYSLRD